ncbi:MAG: S8 family serine peptidase, partial [Silanimonas sp.]
AANANIAARRLSDASRQVARSGLMAKRGPSVGLGYQRRLSVGGDVLRATRLLALDEAAAARAALAAQPGVARVEYDYVLQANLRPNDTRYAEQWAMTDADAGLRAEAAWDVSTGTGVIIGVLDTGIARHTDLDANVVPGYDFITSVTTAGDGNGRDADASDPGDFANGRNSSWHGTHVAGIAAARGNNAAGIAGLAFSAKVMPVRVLGRGGGTTSDIADAIVWASGGAVAGVPTLSAANAADVLNLSLGGPGTCTSALQSAIASAASRGVPVVVAAGNDARDAGAYTPANCPGVITVAAVGANSARASFSNFGAVVDVAAPGVSILSTANAGTQVPGAENFLAYSGTSMAAPYVSATLALVQARRTALRL